MITYEALCRRPAAFRSLTGHSLEQFAALWAQFEPAHQQRCRALTTTKRDGKPRQRAYGGVPRYQDDLRTRVLIGLLSVKIEQMTKSSASLQRRIQLLAANRK